MKVLLVYIMGVLRLIFITLRKKLSLPLWLQFRKNMGTTMVCGKVLWFHGHIPIVFPEGVFLRQKLIRTETNME